MTSHPQTPQSFVATLNTEQGRKLLQGLTDQEFEISKPPHTHYSGKKKGISCTLYQSGKLVVQGKESASFIEFYLEPEILQTFGYQYPKSSIDTTPRIGIDESGKGDFFGPLCIAGVYVKTEQFEALQKMGVKDSKTLSDAVIRKLAKEIKSLCLTHLVRINPPKYNQIYLEFKNLNRLLAWGHATAIEHLVTESRCSRVIIGQFADEWVVEQALSRKKLKVDLTQRHRGEEDLPVAAASIIARAAFLEGLGRLSLDIGFELPKGSSQAVSTAAAKVLRQWGEEKLRSICKQHFKTLDAILGQRPK
jgi:ribonuclease HIII